jgi:hypothetical protein
MKTLLLLFAFLILPLQAETLKIHSLAQRQLGPGYLVKFTNGAVGYLLNKDAANVEIKDLEGRWVEVELSSEREILSLEAAPESNEEIVFDSLKSLLRKDSELEYRPTVYASYQEATNALQRFRRDNLEDAQCYDKAHVWSYEENYYRRSRLLKVFLFFSDSYIERYNHPWWFHVAPLGLVQMGSSINERVMDRGFAQFPLKMKLWTDLFMKNKASCKLMEKYTDYSQHPGEDDCYIYKASMFFWQPKDIEALERGASPKTQFINWEVRHAYKYGYGYDVL